MEFSYATAVPFEVPAANWPLIRDKKVRFSTQQGCELARPCQIAHFETACNLLPRCGEVAKRGKYIHHFNLVSLGNAVKSFSLRISRIFVPFPSARGLGQAWTPIHFARIEYIIVPLSAKLWALNFVAISPGQKTGPC